MPNSGAKILVIDDEAALLHSLTAYLEDSGFVVFSAENGKTGLESFEKDKPDLVLTDLHMPVLGGLEVLSTITKGTTDTPVIVISGAGELNDAIEALRLGAWDYITKPIADLQVLEHAVNKALERKKLLAENLMYAQHIEENLKILEEDQAAGRRVQMSLLPAENLTVKNYSFKHKIIPSLQLSGDFVEYFPINADIYGVYLADVSGHGAASAFVTILLKSLISQYQAHYRMNNDETILVPSQMMQELNKEIFNAKLSKYLTIIYGVINTITNEFTYGIGAHYPSPILIKADGSAEYLPGSGFPVGVMANVKYTNQSIKLKTGEHVIMLSDGIMEILNPGHKLAQKDQELLQIAAKAKNDIAAILTMCQYDPAKIYDQPDDITILTMSVYKPV